MRRVLRTIPTATSRCGQSGKPTPTTFRMTQTAVLAHFLPAAPSLTAKLRLAAHPASLERVTTSKAGIRSRMAAGVPTTAEIRYARLVTQLSGHSGLPTATTSPTTAMAVLAPPPPAPGPPVTRLTQSSSTASVATATPSSVGQPPQPMSAATQATTRVTATPPRQTSTSMRSGMPTTTRLLTMATDPMAAQFHQTAPTPPVAPRT